jgi:hypothetical protein
MRRKGGTPRHRVDQDYLPRPAMPSTLGAFPATAAPRTGVATLCARAVGPTTRAARSPRKSDRTGTRRAPGTRRPSTYLSGAPGTRRTGRAAPAAPGARCVIPTRTPSTSHKGSRTDV